MDRSVKVKPCIDSDIVIRQFNRYGNRYRFPQISSGYPLSIRQELDLKPGMKLHVFRHDDRVEFIPLKSMREMRGILKGIDTSIHREDDRL